MAQDGLLDRIFASVRLEEFLAERELVDYRGEPNPVRTYTDQKGLVLSAVSHRDFLRWMIEMLMPLTDRRIFEVGSGTGYFATLLGRLCGPGGVVHGCEIISELFERSIQNRRLIELGNVFLEFGDFVDVVPRLGTFDIVVVTSCLSRIPPCLIEACSANNGQLALPIEVPGGGDCFTIFERCGDRASVKAAKLSVSVPSTGNYAERPFWAQPIRELIPNFESLVKMQISAVGEFRDPILDTLAFRSYLLFNEPLFDAVNFGEGHLSVSTEMGFGLFDVTTQSACFHRGHSTVAIGARGLELAARFSKHYIAWQQAKRPSLADVFYTIDLKNRHGVELRPALESVTL